MTSKDVPVVSLTGATHDGQPLGYGRMPAHDVRPWFSRLSVSEVLLPEGASLSGGMLHDHPVLCILFGAQWTVHTPHGVREYHPGSAGMTLYFGPHSRLMRLMVHGSFKVITLSLAAGGTAVLGGPLPQFMIDQVIDYDELVGHGRLSSRFDPAEGPQAWLDKVEDEIRHFVSHFETHPPDPLTEAFEITCLTDPTRSLAEFAEANGTTTRTVERCIKRDYGLTPKQAMRRARALDMAAMLLGVTMKEEEEEFRLRYFDQSHLTREMRHFFAMTPRQLREDSHPLLRIGMEIRQSRRVEALKLLGADEIKPWRDPGAEPTR